MEVWHIRLVNTILTLGPGGEADSTLLTIFGSERTGRFLFWSVKLVEIRLLSFSPLEHILL